MVRRINVLREAGLELREAILARTAAFAAYSDDGHCRYLRTLPASLARAWIGCNVPGNRDRVGSVSSTILTLFVVPVLYSIITPRIASTRAVAAVDAH